MCSWTAKLATLGILVTSLSSLTEPLRLRCLWLLEAEASGTAIERRNGRPPAEADTSERIRAGLMVGRAVASVVNLLDLEQVLVGGSVALGFGDPFFEAANRELLIVAA